jgi:hypothetical protein
MTGDEYLERGAALRQTQKELLGAMERANQSGLNLADPYVNQIMQRLEAVTGKLDALNQEFLRAR